METYLINGGAGFIGSNIARSLLGRGAKVKILDNLSTGKLANMSDIIDNVEFIEGDICDLDTMLKVTKGVDYVLHQAALPSVPRSIKDPIATSNVNVNGTLNALTAARENKVRRFVLASSSSIYGKSEQLPKVETMLQQPLSPYATSKLAAEKYTMNFYQVYELPTVALRYFNVFGPHQDPKSQYAAVIPKFITAILTGETLIIHGDGEQSRDFTFIDNVIEANILACTSDLAQGQVMNVACGERYTINELIAKLEGYIGNPANRTYESSRTGDVKHSHADISLARKCLDFNPAVTFDEGLKRTVEWYKKKGKM